MEENKRDDIKFTKPMSNYKLLELIYRKNMLKQYALEYLLFKERSGQSCWLSNGAIREYIRHYYTKDLYWKAPSALLDVCLLELKHLDLVNISEKDEVVYYRITEYGIDALKSFNIQNTAATTLSNFTIYRLTLCTVTVAILALVVSIITLLIKV